ncbi:hypothetical protein [Pseudomonas fluorescens]|uniref:hypothetical protein n=1 Tax=Pseudomonas fluorescens TaxID=294 RepID=UPI0012B83C50|nr:hypothetical protein [Pseudomonas fluorescens]
MTFIKKYEDALQRLKENLPIRIRPGSPISYDNVALEAGRGKGSLKKGRSSLDDLRSQIASAMAEQANNTNKVTKPTDRDLLKSKQNTIRILRSELREIEVRFQQSIGREIMLLDQVKSLLATVESLKMQNDIVVKINSKRPNKPS